MTEKPLISVISVNLNNVNGLEKTIESVIYQTYKDFEYIVIDGGSSDGSKKILEKYNSKISTWLSEPDNGIYNAMNKGIKLAKGDYLLFLNSGDWMVDNQVFGKIVPELTDCDLLYGNLIKEIPSGDSLRDKGPAGQNITLNTFFKGTLNHGASFINKKLFEKYGFYDEKLHIVSDWKFFLVSLGMNNSIIKYIDRDISYFDMEGISNTNLALRDEERLKVLKEELPTPIYNDYMDLNKKRHKLNDYKIELLFINIANRIFRRIKSIKF